MAESSVLHAKVLYAGNFWDRLLDRAGRDPRFDAASDVVDTVAMYLPDRGPAKDLLSGTWLGHALHPMLSALPIGFWTSAMVFDMLGPKYDDAARAMVGAGVVSSIPAALAGASDWNDTTGPSRRVGATHALVNSSALACYIGSWGARRRGHRVTGIGLGLAGATLATIGGFLGGHLVGALGVGVDHTAFEDELEEWARGCDESELSEMPTAIRLDDGTDVLVSRRDDHITAVSGTCPHRGAPLDEGKVEGEIVTCPWHGSEFSLVDGSLRAGPSPAPLRAYDVRVRNHVVEIRRGAG